ncbi:MAG: CHASE2 domain-containing protein [Phenylobacterium sp.]|uniref:CHASE2 domain-containing protein n=1 Tax=Phenylobacterium sp. TaxID=1871053 RepID=UPI001A2F5418|nr:CHASE2 domain-containing protein [Phenylobacterium sp.]MBJ7413112.1 CHASE2 domain-containing protein [Phenylobacterium sp.]
MIGRRFLAAARAALSRSPVDRKDRLARAASLVLIVATVFAAEGSGLLRPLDNALGALRFDLLRRDASQTLTVVEIDPASIRAAGRWPWDRERFAQAIRNLQAAGADTVAFDVDFSARADSAADQALLAAIARQPGSVVLPTFVQALDRRAPARLVENTPLANLSNDALLASVNVLIDPDGLVRRYRYGFDSESGGRASMASLLANRSPGQTADFLIDYGIREKSLDHLSFEDVYRGRFDASQVRGRSILIGSTAQELGDDFATPRHGALPGVYVHALAYESLVAGRDLKALNPLLLGALAVWSAYLLRPRSALRLRRMLLRHLVIAATAIGGPLALQAAAPVSAATASILFAQLLCLIWLVRHELARRARAVVQAREAHLVELAEHMRASRDEILAAHDELKAVNVALDRALAARTDFLAMTSHEIRTPLNGIMGMTQVILSDRNLPAGLRDKVDLVHASGETMLALVDDILDVAKMESGNLTVAPAKMDLHRLLDETARLWTDKAQSKGLGLRCDRGDTPTWIIEDGGRLRQILFNLTSNAIKFTERGEVSLEARTELGEDGEMLVLEVSDNGIGIPADKVEQIFEAFSQVDAGITRKYGGTGLGLAISRRPWPSPDGDLTVDSELDVGSRFAVRLPLRRAAADRGAAGAGAADGVALAAASVLLIEANPLAQGVLKAALASHVSDLEVARSTVEARDALGSRRFDLLLVEGRCLSLGDADAFEEVGRLARESAGAAVVVLWAGPAEETAGLRRAGARLVIPKPIATADLVQELRAFRAACEDPAALGRAFAAAASP